MRLLANGEEVMFLAEWAGPPRHKYWVYALWFSGPVMVDGIECRAESAHLRWQLIIDVEIDGKWQRHDHSGSLQDTFEHILMAMEDAGVPRGLSWVEEKIGPCADPYSMKIAAAPVEWRILES